MRHVVSDHVLDIIYVCMRLKIAVSTARFRPLGAIALKQNHLIFRDLTLAMEFGLNPSSHPRRKAPIWD